MDFGGPSPPLEACGKFPTGHAKHGASGEGQSPDNEGEDFRQQEAESRQSCLRPGAQTLSWRVALDQETGCKEAGCLRREPANLALALEQAQALALAPAFPRRNERANLKIGRSFP